MPPVLCGRTVCILYPATDLKYSPLMSQFSGTFAKLRKESTLASSCLSVRPHGTARPPLDGFA